ncbi:MAG: hypothetical protein ABIE94_04900 [archaeon]
MMKSKKGNEGGAALLGLLVTVIVVLVVTGIFYPDFFKGGLFLDRAKKCGGTDLTYCTSNEECDKFGDVRTPSPMDKDCPPGKEYCCYNSKSTESSKTDIVRFRLYKVYDDGEKGVDISHGKTLKVEEGVDCILYAWIENADEYLECQISGSWGVAGPADCTADPLELTRLGTQVTKGDYEIYLKVFDTEGNVARTIEAKIEVT